MAVQNNQIWTGLQALPTFDLYAQLYLQPLDPTPANYTTRPYKNLQLGTFWLNTVNHNLWYLANLTLPPHIEGNWIQISGGSLNIEKLQANTGGPVGPNGSNIINVVGDGVGITIAGNPGTNTLTASLIGGGVAAQSFPTDAGTATPAAGVLNVFGGTAGRDINTTGAGNTVHVELNNAITLGDLSAIPATSPAITIDSGDINFTANNLLATTNQRITFGVFPHLNIISFYFDNIFIGAQAGNTTLTPGVGIFNVGIGQFSGSSITTGHQNTALGNASLQALTTGISNSVFGYTSGASITTGSGNMAIGDGSLAGLVTGSNNISIGFASGSAYNGAESGNILIGTGVSGVNGESNVCRIANIFGATGNGTGIPVLVDNANQLCTVASSARYKDNIQTMNGASDAIHYLRPVIFNYKEDASKRANYGLIAEEVAQIMPNLVVYDDMDEPETVRYLDLIPMLLNEIQKQRKLVMDLISHVGVLEQDVMKLKAKKKS